MINTPILLLGFNRPLLIKNQLELLKRFNVNNVTISIDGPRNSLDKKKILEIDEIISNYKDEFSELSIYKNIDNLGCKNAIESALDGFFKNNKFGIILEDDCVPNLEFFQYCEFYLDHFEGDQNIGSISGSKFGNLSNQTPFFSKISLAIVLNRNI